MAPIRMRLEGLLEFLQVRLLALVWPGDPPCLPTVLMVTWCQSLQINDLTLTTALMSSPPPEG